MEIGALVAQWEKVRPASLEEVGSSPDASIMISSMAYFSPKNEVGPSSDVGVKGGKDLVPYFLLFHGPRKLETLTSPPQH